jgi:hypothetical protein
MYDVGYTMLKSFLTSYIQHLTSYINNVFSIFHGAICLHVHCDEPNNHDGICNADVVACPNDRLYTHKSHLGVPIHHLPIHGQDLVVVASLLLQEQQDEPLHTLVQKLLLTH